VDKELNEFFSLYRTKFVLVYADYVALKKAKPEQILIEESNMIDHIAQYFNDDLDEPHRKGNLEKATNHLMRALIDINKLLWIALHEYFEPLLSDSNTSLVFNAPYDEVYKKFSTFMNLGRDARRFEVTHIGNSLMDTVKHYEEINDYGLELFKLVDQIKLARYKKWTRIFISRDFYIGFAASLFASVIFWFIGQLISSPK